MGCHKKKGFTLVELIVVLLILGILIALLVPALTVLYRKGKEKKYSRRGKTGCGGCSDTIF